MTERKDIFDRIMDWRVFKPLQPFYQRHKEVLLYLLFGGLTTLISMLSFALGRGVGMNEHVANVISWILAVTFAFMTNRIWVFPAQTQHWCEWAKQAVSFYGGRVATLLVEEAIVLIFITWLHLPDMAVKAVAQVVLIVLNYFISKFAVFRQK